MCTDSQVLPRMVINEDLTAGTSLALHYPVLLMGGAVSVHDSEDSLTRAGEAGIWIVDSSGYLYAVVEATAVKQPRMWWRYLRNYSERLHWRLRREGRVSMGRIRSLLAAMPGTGEARMECTSVAELIEACRAPRESR